MIGQLEVRSGKDWVRKLGEVAGYDRVSRSPIGRRIR
jgi:hypothetical protein